MTVTATARVTVGAVTLSRRVWALIADARKGAGLKPDQARVVQGSFHGGVSASAGTHDGGGAFDLSISGLNRSQQVGLVVELRRRNVCAWLRTKDLGWNGDPHIHGIVRDEPGLSPAASKQVRNYDAGNNSLAGASRQRDTLPRPAQHAFKEVTVVPVPTFKPGGMYKTPLNAPVKVVGSAGGYVVARTNIPAGGTYLLTLQVRMPKDEKVTAETEFVRVGWGTSPRDATGQNSIPAATRFFGVWRRWRTVNHEIAGGGPVEFMIYMPAGSFDMRFVTKALKIA